MTDKREENCELLQELWNIVNSVGGIIGTMEKNLNFTRLSAA